MKLFGKWGKDSTTSNGNDPFAAADGNATSGVDKQANAGLGKGRTILVVDDNPVVLKAFELKLKTLGFNVITAAEGSTAVSVARQEQPDLMVLDINFPPDVGSSGLQWDGFNIMQWMHRFQEAADIPVIIITSGDPAKFKERALAAGAVAFFQKPINNEEFIFAVRRVLGQTEAKIKAQ